MIETLGDRVFILGGSGLLGTELVNHFERSGDLVFAPSRTDVPLTNAARLQRALQRFQPQLVVNAAAYTDVDGAEHDHELARQVNVAAVQTIVESSYKLGFRFIQMSTASVFAGNKGDVFGIYSDICPVNAYNASKAEAEQVCAAALESGGNVAWVRTYWLYGPRRKSFVDLVVESLSARQQIDVVSDQWGQPTYAPDLAARVRAIAEDRTIVGPVHGVNSGTASRLDWATAIADLLNLDVDLIVPVSARDFGAPAPRPVACLLKDSSEADGLAPLRPWRDALSEYLAVRYS